MRQQVPEWFPERFFNNIKDELESNGRLYLDWMITKPAMVATLNYIRSKGYKCTWKEKREGQYFIQITKNTSPNNG